VAALSRFARRLVPARADLAAGHLEGTLDAPRFAAGETRAVLAPLLDLTAEPDPAAERATQLLRGERFTVYEERDGLAWGQAQTDLYVGYVSANGLAPLPAAPTRAVTALRSHVYPEPSVRARPREALPFGAQIAVAGAEAGWVRLAEGGFVWEAHLAPVEGDFVDQAARFLGVPYLWGGRSAEGLDCSALVQLALAAVGVRAPRDSDMQAAMVGSPIDDAEAHERGDLVFWRGHVGIMTDGAALLHANAHAMAVTREPLAMVVERVRAADGGPVLATRRGAAGSSDWLAAF
jgi:cell wall-associated NlpC family hydrolase